MKQLLQLMSSLIPSAGARATASSIDEPLPQATGDVVDGTSADAGRPVDPWPHMAEAPSTATDGHEIRSRTGPGAGRTSDPGVRRIALPGEHMDAIVDLIWEDVSRRIPRSQVAAVAQQVAREFQDARILAYVPLFVRRVATRRLLEEQEPGSPIPHANR